MNWQAHYVEETAFYPFDEKAALALDPVSSGGAFPLTGIKIPPYLRGAQRRNVNGGAFRAGDDGFLFAVPEGEAGKDPVAGPRHGLQIPAGFPAVGGFAEDSAVQIDACVGAEDSPVGQVRPFLQEAADFHLGEPLHLTDGRGGIEFLLEAGGDRCKGYTEGVQELTASRG